MPKVIYLLLLLISLICSCTNRGSNRISTSSAFDSISLVADKLADSGLKEEALHLISDWHSKAKDLTVEDEIDYFSYSNVIYNHNKNYERSIQIADSMLMILDKADENDPSISSARIVAYNIKADALFAKGMYNDAYNYYFIAQKLAIDNKDTCYLRTYTYSLAMTLFRQQRYQQSAMRFREAYDQSDRCPEDFNLFYFKQELLDNIGLCYNALEKYDSAMHFYNKALTYLNEHTGKYEHKLMNVYEAPKAVVYGNMAEVYRHLGKYDSAKVLYEHSININLQKGYTNTDALVNQVKLADLYFKTGDIPDARITLEKIKAELDTIPDRQVEMMWHKLMWQYCELINDSVQSYKHLRIYTMLNDKYISDNKALMETDLDMRVKDLEKQYKINLLTKDKRQQKTYLIIVTILAFMAVAIIFLILRNAWKRQKNIKILTDLNNKVNEQKKQLEKALEELQTKEKDKARILKSVAHDVMNPIAAIISLTDILLHEKDSYTPEQLEILNLILEASNNSLNLSKDILEASEEIDEKNMTKEKTDINKLVSKSVELLNFKALSKKQHIITKLPEPPVYAYVYKDKMRRVINNILANAIKFSYENSDIEIILENIAGDVHIAIKDSGIGIPEQNKANVFDMFTDAKTAGTSGEIPHGLGLSISLQIARAHNGDIWFESTEGKGTTFHLVFPVNGDNAA
jgi:signal transduction histidine kinase